MKFLILLLAFSTTMNGQVLFDFNTESSIGGWFVLDDGVMGGRSLGTIDLNEDGFGVFSGDISLENNGGFSSVRLRIKITDISNYSKIVLKIKGDGKDYQFRIKNKTSDYFSYISPFPTSGGWEEIEVSLSSFYPSFRGRKLNMPNFSGDTIEEIVFLIGNKKTERFKLLIDKVELK